MAFANPSSSFSFHVPNGGENVPAMSMAGLSPAAVAEVRFRVGQIVFDVH